MQVDRVQDREDKRKRPPQKYRHYPLDGDQSAASLLMGRSPYGIYIYRFSDDSWYVGQTINLAERHQQHLHEYRHEAEYEGISLTDMYFMEVDPEKGRSYLSEQEVKAIQWADSQGLRLHNRLITGRPRGEDVATVILDDDTSFSLPWKRELITQGSMNAAPLDDAQESAIKKAQGLEGAPFYEDLREVLGIYLGRTIHEAAASAGLLWSVSALPATNGGKRLMTFSISTLETVFVIGSVRNGIEFVRVNCKRPEEDRRIAPPLLRYIPYKADYRAAEDVVAYEFDTLDDFRDALDNERFLDWCYRLNIELMRKSPTFHKQGFNPLFAKNLLEVIQS